MCTLQGQSSTLLVYLDPNSAEALPCSSYVTLRRGEGGGGAPARRHPAPEHETTESPIKKSEISSFTRGSSSLQEEEDNRFHTLTSSARACRLHLGIFPEKKSDPVAIKESRANRWEGTRNPGLAFVAAEQPCQGGSKQSREKIQQERERGPLAVSVLAGRCDLLSLGVHLPVFCSVVFSHLSSYLLMSPCGSLRGRWERNAPSPPLLHYSGLL